MRGVDSVCHQFLISEQLSCSVRDAFPELDATPGPTSGTVLHGPVRDVGELHGFLAVALRVVGTRAPSIGDNQLAGNRFEECWMVESQHPDERVGHLGWGRYVVNLVRRTYEAWRDDRVLRLGAGLAYYALFALVPLLAIVIALAGLAFSQAEVQEAVVAPLADSLDVDREVMADALDGVLKEITPSSGLGMIGVGSLLLAATLLFVALQDAFDVIWHVPVEVGIEYTLRRRATALLVIVVMAALVIALFVLQTAIGLLEAVFPTDRLVLSALTETLAGAGSWVLGAATVALVFRILPRTDVGWRAAIIGGAITTTVLALGGSLFGFYLRNFGARSAERAAASVLVLLLWFYAMSQIVLAGAVLTRQIDEPAPR